MKKTNFILMLLTALVTIRASKSQQQENSTNVGTDNDKGVTLIGGSIPSEGNVYVINSKNKYGPICHNIWSQAAATVVCRQLGYEDGMATDWSIFGTVPDDFAMYAVHCIGNETRIQDCQYRTDANCAPHGGAGVQCVDSNVSVLLKGYKPNQGTIYVFNSEKQLLPVCAHSWERADARVVCRQLDYADGVATKRTYYGSIFGNFSMDHVNCTGDEARIQDCSYSDYGGCDSQNEMVQIAAVRCSNISLEQADCSCSDFIDEEGFGQCKKAIYDYKLVCYVNMPSTCSNIRESQTNPGMWGSAEPCNQTLVILLGGSIPSEGNIISINSENNQGPVCDDNWGDSNARVVCQQLGYADGVATKRSLFRERFAWSNFAMDDVNCTGDEARLQDCSYNTHHNCYNHEGAGVRCSNVTLNHSRETRKSGGQCECNGVIGTNKYGKPVGQCKTRTEWNSRAAFFCFIKGTSTCMDKSVTPDSNNPRNEKDMKFFSVMACYSQQDTDDGKMCTDDSTICGESCLPPGQNAQKDHNVYCCINGNSSQIMRMDQACHGTSQCCFPTRSWEFEIVEYKNETKQWLCGIGSRYGRERSLCGITSPSCIYSVMESRQHGDVYCCHGQAIGKDELCSGCDYTSLPCKPNNSSQCLHVHKWCDGIKDCPEGEDEVDITCRSKELFQRSCGQSSSLSRCEDRVGQCFFSSRTSERLVFGHRCIDRSDRVANNSVAISTPSPPLLNFCIDENGDSGVQCGYMCWPYRWWCNEEHNDRCTVGNSTVRKLEVNICTGEGKGIIRLGDNEFIQTDGYNNNTFCERMNNLKLDYLYCDNGSRCYHASLKCDGKSQCLDKSDEEDCRCPVATRPDHQRLPQIQTGFLVHNYNIPQATFACRNKVNDTDICGIRCDGVIECLNNLDESGCELPTYYLFFILIALSVIAIILAEFGKFFQPEIINTSTLKTLQITENLLSILKLQHPTFQEKKKLLRLIKVHHRRNDFSQRLELIHAVISMNPDREMAKRATKALYEGFLLMHDKDKTRTFMCLRKNVRNANFIEGLQDSADPGFFRTLISKKFKNWYHQTSVQYPMILYITFTIRSTTKMGFYFLDFAKDVASVYIVAAVTFSLHVQDDQETAWQSAYVNINDYHVQLLLVLSLSVLAPLLINTFMASRYHPGAAVGMLVDNSSVSKPTLGLLVSSSFLFCITTQVVVLWRLMRTQLEITRLKVGLQSHSNRTDIVRILQLQKEVEIWEKILLQHKKSDVSMEISVQSIVEILMLLLIKASSRSKQVFGLEELFKAEEWFFYLALINTIKKIVMTNLDLIQSKKGFLGFKGKMILALNYLLSGGIRVTAIVAFFAGPLGLFDILIGFQPDPPFVKATDNAYIPILPSALDSLYSLTVADVIFFPLKYYYIAFMIFVVLHCGLILVLKQIYAPSFKRSSSWFQKFLNIIHCFTFIEELEDFDEDPKVVTMGELKKRYTDSHRERIIMFMVFLTENLILTLPLTYTSYAMGNFYEQLSTKTTLLPEEDKAFTTCRVLVWLPIIVTVMNLPTLPLFQAYYTMGHPWKVLVNSFEEMDNENIDFCEQLDKEDFAANKFPLDIEEGEHIEMVTVSDMRTEEEGMKDSLEKELLDDDRTDTCKQFDTQDLSAQVTELGDIDATEMMKVSHEEDMEGLPEDHPLMVEIKGDNLKRNLWIHKKRKVMLRRNFFSTICESKDIDTSARHDFYSHYTGMSFNVTKDGNTDICKQWDREDFTSNMMTHDSITESSKNTGDKEMVNISETKTKREDIEDVPKKESLAKISEKKTGERVNENTLKEQSLSVREDFTANMTTPISNIKQVKQSGKMEMVKISETRTEEDDMEDIPKEQSLAKISEGRTGEEVNEDAPKKQYLKQSSGEDLTGNMITIISDTEQNEHTGKIEMAKISEMRSEDVTKEQSLATIPVTRIEEKDVENFLEDQPLTGDTTEEEMTTERNYP